jgi:hypothetical protein
MIRSTLAAAVTTAWVIFLPAAALAQSPRTGVGHEALAACGSDLATLCGTIERGGGRKVRCLKDNQAKLSPTCATAIQNVLDGRDVRHSNDRPRDGKPAGSLTNQPLSNAADIRAICRSDIATVCAGVERGQGRIAKCLEENASKLSTACQTARAEQKARVRVLKTQTKRVCAADLQSLCGTTEKGHGQMACLREKQAQASAPCQQALATVKPR